MSGTNTRYQEMELVWQARDRLEAAGLSPDVRVHTAMIHVSILATLLRAMRCPVLTCTVCCYQVLCINNMLEVLLLSFCYAVSGTDLALAMRCPVQA
eukprot:1737306-Rhodomonas_salina.4